MPPLVLRGILSDFSACRNHLMPEKGDFAALSQLRPGDRSAYTRRRRPSVRQNGSHFDFDARPFF
ncbi:MAG: hypothetical protein Q8S56_04180, partial [Polaromonas sp.]|nr:hypothetical protein [Polaromonas sp.]